MSVVTATSLGTHVGGEPLFSDVSFRLGRGDRMTLSGRNGAGKTTLLRILAGESEYDSGALSLQQGGRVSLHDQRPPRDQGLGLGEYVFSGRADVIATEKELERLEAAMSDGSNDPATLKAYSAAQQRLELAGGYRWRDQVLTVTRGLGFTGEQLERPLSTFSGGELTRASLARALAVGSDLLLLDEPTNHLDIPTLEWLEEYLTGLDAAVVLVAHDRWFLESVGTSVLELEGGRARFFAGPWHAWRKEKAAREVALGKQIEKQEAEIARMERFVERFRYKATKAKQAQSRLRQIDKIKAGAATRDPADGRSLQFEFLEPERASRVVLRFVKGRIEVPGRTLLENADFLVERDEHVVLVGPNGAGKTTLMATLAGKLKPAAGSVRLGHNARVGYLSQHAETLTGEGTVLEAAVRETGLSGQKVRDLLGLFLFSGNTVEKKLNEISGGEQRRLSLAILVASGANLLLLDEPTNHLDIESREALEDALQAFQGALILISHDRALLEAVGQRTLVCENGSLADHYYGWAEVERRREEKQQATERRQQRVKAPAPGRQREADRRRSNSRRQRVNRIEKRIELAEADLAELEDELADPAAWSTPERSEESGQRHRDAKKRVADLYEQWEAAESENLQAG